MCQQQILPFRVHCSLFFTVFISSCRFFCDLQREYSFEWEKMLKSNMAHPKALIACAFFMFNCFHSLKRKRKAFIKPCFGLGFRVSRIR